MASKKSNTVISIIATIIVLTLCVKIIGFLRDGVLSAKLGAGWESDAYLMGLSVTTIIFLSLGTAITTTVIPIMVKVKKNEKDEVISSILNFLLIISLVIAGVYLIFTPNILKIVAAGFQGDKALLTIKLTRIMIPTSIFICVAYLFVGLLQASEHYIVPVLISVPYNVIIIIYLITGLDNYGITGLAVVTLIGWGLQMAVQIPKIRSVVNFKYKFKIDYQNNYFKEFIGGLLPITFVTATQHINVLIDNAFVSSLGDGKVSAVYFGNLLFTAIVTTAVYGITAVMFPKFNKHYIKEDKKEFNETIASVLKGIVLLLLPIFVGIMFVGEKIISVIFMRGEFTAVDVTNTTVALVGYASFMVAFGIWDVLNKAFYTIGNKRIPMVITSIIVICNVVFNSIFVKMFGFVGIPIATSIAFYIGIIISIMIFTKENKGFDFRLVLLTFFKSIVSVIMMGIGIAIINTVLGANTTSNSNASRIMFVAIDTCIGIVIYLLALIILKERTIIEIVNKKKGIRNHNKRRKKDGE